MNNNEGKKAAILGEVTREAYEASVVHRMAGRSGAYTPKGAPGNALEIMANDKANLQNIFKPGTVTRLTKSPTATQVDAVTMQGNKVLERIQYKDTASASGIRKTLKQVESGKYRQAQLRGTIETAEKFNQMASERGITKTMKSTGISSKATKRIGDKFTGQAPKLSSVGDAVKSSAGIAVGVTAGIEVVKSVANGDSIGECAGHVVSKSSESAVTAAASAATAELATGAVTSILSSTAIPVAGPALAASALVALGTGVLVSELTDGAFDEIGDSVSNLVDGVSDTVSDVLFDIGNFFDGLFI